MKIQTHAWYNKRGFGRLGKDYSLLVAVSRTGIWSLVVIEAIRRRICRVGGEGYSWGRVVKLRF